MKINVLMDYFVRAYRASLPLMLNLVIAVTEGICVVETKRKSAGLIHIYMSMRDIPSEEDL